MSIFIIIIDITVINNIINIIETLSSNKMMLMGWYFALYKDGNGLMNIFNNLNNLIYIFKIYKYN